MSNLEISADNDLIAYSKHDLVRIVSNGTENSKLNEQKIWDESEKRNWTVILFVGTLLVYCVRTSMSVCLPAIAKEMGWSKQISGMALSAFFFGYLSTNVLGGYFADRHGGEKMMMFSSVIWSTLTVLLPLTSTTQVLFNSGTYAILALRFFTGCSQGFFFPSFTSMLSKHVKTEDKGSFTGIVYSGSSIGTILTGLFGSIIMENYSWRMVFVLIGLLCYLWIYMLRFLYHAGRNISKNEGTSYDQIRSHERFPWRILLRKAAVWAFLIGHSLNGYTFFVLLSWTPAYFHDMFPESKGWIFNVVPWIASFLMSIVSGYYANYLLANGSSVTFLRKSYAAVVFLGTVAFSLLLTAVRSFNQALIVMSLNVAVNTFGTSAITLNAQDLAPKHAGTLYGIGNSLSALGGTLGIYLAGFILEHGGHWSSVFIINAVVSFFGFILFQLFGSGEKVI